MNINYSAGKKINSCYIFKFILKVFQSEYYQIADWCYIWMGYGFVKVFKVGWLMVFCRKILFKVSHWKLGKCHLSHCYLNSLFSSSSGKVCHYRNTPKATPETLNLILCMHTRGYRNKFHRLCKTHHCNGRYKEPILPIRRIHKLRRAPETPGGPLALKDDLIIVLFWIWPLAMKTWMIIYCNAALSPFLCKNQSNHVTWMW